ncbi:hypothetical protein [Streptomyces sp. NPDC059122]|uniref:hypothetical protein n=1 Tax=Streptomyces sp. NPDC059122 TaxID=3346732 RepID=UPI0036CE279F
MTSTTLALSGLRDLYERPLLAYINDRVSPLDWCRGRHIARMAWAEAVGSLHLAPDTGMEDGLPAWLAAAARRTIRGYLAPSPTLVTDSAETTHPAGSFPLAA